MNITQRLIVSGQTLVAVVVIFGIHFTAQGKAQYSQKPKFTPRYKVERCDCFGFSEDIPTFLSDLANARELGQLDIYGEGKSIEEAEDQALSLCIETYRHYASRSQNSTPESVTQSGCKRLQSTPEGEWVALN